MQSKNIHIIRMTVLSFFVLAALPVSAKEFLNAFLHVNIGITWNAGSFGPIIDREKATLLSQEESDTFSYSKPTFLHTAIDLSMDLVPFKPLILGYEAHAFKFGVRGGVKFHSFQETMDVNSNGEDSSYSGTLMSYSEWFVGLVVRYAPSITISGIKGNYTADKGFIFYALYGNFFKGSLNAYPARANYGDDVGSNSTGLDGHKFEFGFGFEFHVCSVNLGINLGYAFIIARLDTDVYGDIGTESNLHEVNVGLYLSLPLEYLL